MVEPAEITGQSDTEISEQRALLEAAIADFNNNPLDTIERVYAYNARSQGMKIVVSGAGTDGDFIQSCSWRLNQLLGTDEGKAKTLNDKLKSILDGSSGNVKFDVWCDVDRIMTRKSRQKKDKN